jgi:tripartite-type tricarboxylate transporter receptor subunit TctC
MKRLFAALLAAAIFAFPAPAADPIKMVVPFAAGGPVDALARIVAAEIGPRLQTDVVVENRGGAGGLLAVEQVRARRPTAAPSCSPASAPS